MASPTLERTAREQAARQISAPYDKGDVSSPAYECASYRAQIDDVRMMAAVAGGTKTMRAKGKEFLPEHPMEPAQKYETRNGIAVAFNALARTVTGLVGMIFRRDPVLSEDVDPGIVEATEDIDRRGHSLPVFMHRISQDALRDGHTWVHVEAPRAGSVQTRGEERAMGVRPYWIPVTKAQAINWRYEMREGEPVLTLFVYRTGGTEPDGAFGEKQLEQIRVMRLTPTGPTGELWQKVEKTDTESERWRRIETYPIDNDRIPVVFLPSRETGPFESEPPLRDLAYEQIERYRVRSDRQKSLTFSAIAVPWVFGKEVTDAEGNSKVRWSADSVMLLNDPEASAGILESSGSGLSAMKDELAAIDATMASLGMQMLVRPSGPQPSRSGDVTATSDVMRRSESEAALVLFADAIESATNECLKLHAGYSSKSPEPGTVTINRDFHDDMIDPARAAFLHELVASGDLSWETFMALLVSGEMLAEDFDPDEEREKIAAETAGRLADIEEVMRERGDDGEGQPADEAA